MIARADARRPQTESKTQLPKKPNYDFEKRRKEQDRKQKKDAKREERLLRKRGENAPDGEAGEGDEPVAEDEVTAGE